MKVNYLYYYIKLLYFFIGINIRFLYPCGFKAVWTFNENSFVEDLYDFAFYSIPEKEGAYKFYL